MATGTGSNDSSFWIWIAIGLLCVFPFAFSGVIPRHNLTAQFIKDLRHKPFWRDSHNAQTQNIIQELALPSYLRTFIANYEQGIFSEEDLFTGINENCQGHIKEWIVRVTKNVTDLSTDEEKWVWHMFDAWGKIPEGIFSGHIASFGDFHECIQIDVRDLEVFSQKKDISKRFRGRYCTTMIIDYNSLLMLIGGGQTTNEAFPSKHNFVKGAEILESVSLRELLNTISGQAGATVMGAIAPSIAVCMPNSCSQEEIQVFFMNALYAAVNAIPDLEPENLPWPVVAFCEEEAMPSFTAGDIVVIVLLSVILGLCLGAGIIDYWLHDGVDNTPPPKRGKAFQYLMAFSAYTNTKKWLSTRKSGDDLGCIHGIRFFSTSWVVYAHTYAVFSMTPAWNGIDVQKIYEDWSLMPILNGTFSVDSFFVMSGMLAAYNILKMLDKTKGKLNLIMFYIHRYIRLTPTYAILVAIMATLVVYVGRGPYWMVITMQAQQCRDNWWTNLLYINNIVKAEEMCNGESWYLANDFQFYVLSPLMVYPIWRWRKAGLALLSIYTVLSIIAPVLVVRYSETWPAALLTRDMGGFVEIYQRPWSRIQTFIVGIWLGWLLHELKGKRVKIPVMVACLLWVASTAMAILVIYGIRPWFDPTYDIPEIAGYFYAGLSRFTWAVVVSWIIFACVKGYGGIVNKFLSWKAFMPLGRLTFCVYLTSFHLQMIYQARVTQPMRYDAYNMVNLFFAHQVMSFLIGFLCTLFFESPFIILQKLIFEGSPKDNSKPPLPQRKSSVERDSKKRNGIFYNDTSVMTSAPKAELSINGNAKSIN